MSVITTDTTPRFNLKNQLFSPVEGTLGVASIKSTLDKSQLYNALDGIASIPPTKGLNGRVSPLTKIKNYDDWPYKIVYANKGIKGATIMRHINTFYNGQRNIPINRRPNIIHVAGNFAIIRADLSEDEPTPEYFLSTEEPDLHAIVCALNGLQQRAMASTKILFLYGHLIENVISAGKNSSSS